VSVGGARHPVGVGRGAGLAQLLLLAHAASSWCPRTAAPHTGCPRPTSTCMLSRNPVTQLPYKAADMCIGMVCQYATGNDSGRASKVFYQKGARQKGKLHAAGAAREGSEVVQAGRYRVQGFGPMFGSSARRSVQACRVLVASVLTRWTISFRAGCGEAPPTRLGRVVLVGVGRLLVASSPGRQASRWATHSIAAAAVHNSIHSLLDKACASLKLEIFSTRWPLQPWPEGPCHPAG
jgi:hypothetical protein